jgi:membrane protease YdiL (CAAX protease family)
MMREELAECGIFWHLTEERSPRTGRVGGRLWLALIPGVLLLVAEELILAIPPVAGHGFSAFVESDAGQAYLSGNWGWFAIIVALMVFNTVLGEELLFRACCWRECRVRLGVSTGLPKASCSRPTTWTCRG